MTFTPFSREHFITLAIGAGVVALILLLGRHSGKLRTSTTALLAFVNLSSYAFSQAAWLSLGRPLPLDNILPFHLCDIGAFTAGFALLTRKPLLCAMTYFWGLAATLQALLTPAVQIGFPSPPFIMFFVQHFAIVATALYLPIVDGWRPRQPFWKSPLEIFAWSILYLIFAMTINHFFKTNYGFASRPPDNPSLIDHLGPWPWYLFSMQAIALALFLLLALPFRKSTNE
ncbi:MAG: TIGR02206 family membrane protein [Gloeobacteraceae cyanobacterium ES-bin-144]|nr:TIGR02206 family membrane protein [Verrucomicrobiales bacterium]